MKLQLLDDNSIWRLYKGDLTKELAKRGIYIGPGVEINNNIRINKGAYINDGVYLGKGVHINENVYIGSGAYICNRVSLNEGVHISRCVHIDACVSIQANTEIASARDYVSLSRILWGDGVRFAWSIRFRYENRTHGRIQNRRGAMTELENLSDAGRKGNRE